MKKNKHIALWTCPRSRSTLMTRSFEQLDGCLIFDEPFYGSYLLTHGLNHPHREECLRVLETDPQKIIKKITGDLPEKILFSWQKHMAKHTLVWENKDWLKYLDNFFLIREPKEIVYSYNKVYPKVTKEDIGIETLYNIFQNVRSITGKTPLVINSTDLIKNPATILNYLCDYFNIPFDSKMLNWDLGLQNSNLLYSGVLSGFKETWYSSINNSQGFIPYQEKEIKLSPLLENVVADCLPFYEKMNRHRLILK